MTPVRRLVGILDRGLLVDPPERTFRTRGVVYLALSEPDAHRWAGELARELG